VSVPGDRLARILARLSPGAVAPSMERLCSACVEVTEMSGAGMMLMAGDLPQGSLCTSNDVSAVIEELQYTYGEGPCVDAYHQRRPVAEPALADPAQPRWPAFTPGAVAAGAGAVFGFPLGVGGVRFGVLNLYRDRPGPLTADQHADALVLANVAAQVVLDMQAGAPPDTIAAALAAGANFQLVVHQAAGMVAVQLGVSVTEALIRLRARAFAHDQLLSEIAVEVVERRFRFDDDDGEASS